jgi:hypothetical protein
MAVTVSVHFRVLLVVGVRPPLAHARSLSPVCVPSRANVLAVGVLHPVPLFHSVVKFTGMFCSTAKFASGR